MMTVTLQFTKVPMAVPLPEDLREEIRQMETDKVVGIHSFVTAELAKRGVFKVDLSL
jgi:hypothetical protein